MISSAPVYRLADEQRARAESMAWSRFTSPADGAEFYNAFNHTQYSGLDTGARFDAQGRQVNARFGEFTAARNARIIQLALRFVF